MCSQIVVKTEYIDTLIKRLLTYLLIYRRNTSISVVLVVFRSVTFAFLILDFNTFFIFYGKTSVYVRGAIIILFLLL